MQGLENQLPNAFINIKKVTKFIHIDYKYPDTYWCLWRTIGECHSSKSEIRLKRSIPIGSNDSVPRKKERKKKKQQQHHMKSLVLLKSLQIWKGWKDETQLDKQLAPKDVQIDQIPIYKTEEISLNHMGETRNHSDIIIDNIFTF